MRQTTDGDFRAGMLMFAQHTMDFGNAPTSRSTDFQNGRELVGILNRVDGDMPRIPMTIVQAFTQ